MHAAQLSFDHGARGFEIAAEAAAKTVNFCKLIPLTDGAVIGAITFRRLDDSVPYDGDTDIIGVALTKGVAYPISGSAVTMSTGSAMLIRANS